MNGNVSCYERKTGHDKGHCHCHGNGERSKTDMNDGSPNDTNYFLNIYYIILGLPRVFL